MRFTNDIKVLKRRRDHLYHRMELNGKADTGFSWDKREAKVLERIIRVLEDPRVQLMFLQEDVNGEEADISD